MPRLRPTLLTALLLALPLAAADGPQERVTNDRHIIDLLARVHDQGAALFNAGDHAGCYRMFQGSLVTVKLVLPKDLQDHIERGMGRAELEQDVVRRSLLLHELIEDVRKRLHPSAGKAEPLPKPKPVMGEGTPVKDIPGVPRPGDVPKKPEPEAKESDKPKDPIFATPEPPKAPAVPPGKFNLDAPPPVVSGVPTSNPKPARPMPLPDEPMKEALAVPPRPIDAPPVSVPPPINDATKKPAGSEPPLAPPTKSPEPPPFKFPDPVPMKPATPRPADKPADPPFKLTVPPAPPAKPADSRPFELVPPPPLPKSAIPPLPLPTPKPADKSAAPPPLAAPEIVVPPPPPK